MNELSLFTGAGGGLLGSILLGWHPIGYVEWDDYCQRVIAARIKDGILPDAPIFGNIKTFISDWYAASYQGLVDVITGGFPCQPFSVAGKQKGADDERNMWPATAECIGIVRPRFVLLENVPGIRSYLPVVVRDLRRLGYEVSRPLILGADDVGAPHRRDRVWIVGYAESSRKESITSASSPRHSISESDCHASDTAERFGQSGGPRQDKRGIPFEDKQDAEPSPYTQSREAHATEPGGLHAESCGEDSDATDSEKPKCELSINTRAGREGFANGCEFIADTETTGLERRDTTRTSRTDGRLTEYFDGNERDNETEPWTTPWPEVATRLCRVDDGVDK